MMNSGWVPEKVHALLLRFKPSQESVCRVLSKNDEEAMDGGLVWFGLVGLVWLMAVIDLINGSYRFLKVTILALVYALV